MDSMYSFQASKDSLPMFSAFARGYLSEASCVLTRDEIRSLPLGARLMTLENGLRFLADYLNGDLYFHVSRQDQNLDRARAQFALAKDMEVMVFDAAAVKNWAVKSVGFCFSNGLTTGFKGKINPQGEATRAETASMVYRLYLMING